MSCHENLEGFFVNFILVLLLCLVPPLNFYIMTIFVFYCREIEDKGGLGLPLTVDVSDR